MDRGEGRERGRERVERGREREMELEGYSNIVGG